MCYLYRRTRLHASLTTSHNGEAVLYTVENRSHSKLQHSWRGGIGCTESEPAMEAVALNRKEPGRRGGEGGQNDAPLDTGIRARGKSEGLLDTEILHICHNLRNYRRSGVKARGGGVARRFGSAVGKVIR